jgi:phage-related protein
MSRSGKGIPSMEFIVELYESPDGEKFVENELLEIRQGSVALYALLLSGLNRLKDRQNHKEPLCRGIGDGLFELRVGGKDIARVLWFFQSGQRIIAVRCFIKKTRKLPAREREMAIRRMNEYLHRHGSGERG